MIIKLLLVILKCCTLAIINFVPKNKNIWVFGAWFGLSFSDNSKYLFQYINSIESCVKPIWITKDRVIALKLTNDGYNAYYYKSIKGIYYQVVSSVVFVTHSITSDLNAWCIGYRTKRVQLWHGVPLKKIGYDDRDYTYPNNLSLRYLYILDMMRNNYYTYGVSTSAKCKEIFSSAFNLKLKNIEITGFPRNDVFTDSNFICNNKGEPCRVIYMPTFRSDYTGSCLFGKYGFDLSKIDERLFKNNITLDIRVHPANKPSSEIVTKIQKCKKIFFSTVDDIYEEIDSYDILITDYSSIMFDFALSGRPVLLAAFDVEEYTLRERAMYFDYKKLFKDRLFYNWEELLSSVISIKEGARFDIDDALTLMCKNGNRNNSCETVYTWLKKNGL